MLPAYAEELSSMRQDEALCVLRREELQVKAGMEASTTCAANTTCAEMLVPQDRMQKGVKI